MVYVANSRGKKCAINWAYSRLEKLRKEIKSDGMAVTLAGPEAGELGVFDRYLKQPREKSLFVDNSVT